VEINRAGTVVY